VNRFENKVVIVTGGGGGIGRSTVLRFAQEGGAVGVADINGAAAEAVAEEARAAGGQAIALPVDVSDEAAVKSMIETIVEAFGGLDVLHNNAALLTADILGRDKDVVEFERDVFEQTMTVNVLGPMFAVKYAIPQMLERGKGAIVNTSSLAATRAQRELPIYGMSKAALEAFTRYVAVQYSKRRIRCNNVSPGAIVTPKALETGSEEHRQKRLGDVLTPRLGDPKDIAATAVFLASDDAEYITGHTIQVDGGWSTHVI
jgi:NAD(P)-dependent dehydrogenase (short-subunit alcohol dehydrogenase family)